jgi:hypothetical protein
MLVVNETICLQFTTHGLENPKQVKLPAYEHLMRRAHVDRGSNTLLFWSGRDPSWDFGGGGFGGSMTDVTWPPGASVESSEEQGKLLAYDGTGFRDATKEEEQRFAELSSQKGSGEPSIHDSDPKIEIQEVRRGRLLERLLLLLPGYRHGSVPRWKLYVDGKLVRVIKGEWYFESSSEDGSWNNELQLCIWAEYLHPEYVNYFVMDREGHYRLWRTGEYWVELPRREVGSSEAGE